MKKLIANITISFISGLLGAFIIFRIMIDTGEDKNQVRDYGFLRGYTPVQQPQAVSNASYGNPFLHEDFTEASEKSTGSVVFIETLSEVEYRMGGWMDWFFKPQPHQRVSSGSGVVFQNDGYIVTNNHVISDADEITVIAGKKSYEATLIGRDPSSDLAVIKINSNDLPVIEKGNSESVRVGEWVLAVGNPFNLTSTVTAGIVSAKGRNINILRDKFPIESFIQTDAAINPGNSGGALVNSGGKLIGINTAILSRTGSYAGYGFAIPINIVTKVFNDIVNYGEVQKVFLGADYIDLDMNIANRLGVEDLDGIMITDLSKNGAAEKAGLKKRDIIRKINGTQIKTKGNFEEILGQSYPGEELSALVERNGKIMSKKIRLTNRNGAYGIIKREVYNSQELQASFERVSLVEKESYQIKNGIKVLDYDKNGSFSNLGIPKGYIITQINNKPIKSPEEFEEIMINIRGRFDIFFLDERGRRKYIPFRR